jgi:trimeric autotransporter adhesin
MFHRFTLALFSIVFGIHAYAQTNLIFTAPNSTTPGTFNVVLNPSPGPSLTMTGGNNTFVGVSAGQSNQTGSRNTFLGDQAGYTNTTGGFNTFVGEASGYKNTTGNQNTMIGYGAGSQNETGFGNVFTGIVAGEYNVGGAYNVFNGYAAGNFNQNGHGNVAIGSGASLSNVSGGDNVSIGHDTGWGSRGSFNVFLGAGADVAQRNGQYLFLSRATAIGYNAKVSISNALVLGDSVAGTKVGIGVTAPMFALDVKGVINLRSGGTVKFSGLTNPNLRNGTTDQFLTVNADGETVLARYRLTIVTPDQWSDKVFSPSYRLRPLAEVEQFINQHGHLPGIPSAQEVTDKGVDASTMSAKLLEKVEELTLHLIELQKENKRLRELVETRLQDKR